MTLVSNNIRLASTKAVEAVIYWWKCHSQILTNNIFENKTSGSFSISGKAWCFHPKTASELSDPTDSTAAGNVMQSNDIIIQSED